MGCDIHFFVEVRKDGVWKSVDEWVTEDNYFHILYDKRFYTGRNYDLFAILADVRNGRGFAGIKTGEGFNPIADPKGLPIDVSPEVKQSSDGWGGDGHSHSWFTVAELKAYDWNQTTGHQGWVDSHEYQTFKKNGHPDSWCSIVSGGAVTHISNEEMEALIQNEPIIKTPRRDWTLALAKTYTQIHWTEPYSASAGEFLKETIPKLEALGAPDDVRAVFWFDN